MKQVVLFIFVQFSNIAYNSVVGEKLLRCSPKPGCDFPKCNRAANELAGGGGFDDGFFSHIDDYHILCEETTETRRVRINADEVTELRTKLAKLERKFNSFSSECKSQQMEMQREITILKTRQGFCHVRYKQSCFWAVIHDQWDMTLSRAISFCREHADGRLANIYDMAHYDMVTEYLRSRIPRRSKFVDVWTGMAVDPQTGRVSLTGGRPASSLTWHPDYPSYTTTNIAIALQVFERADSTDQGIYNPDPRTRRIGVLCEI